MTSASEKIAEDLRVVVGQLMRRFREDASLPPSQYAVLGLLSRNGPTTTSQLSAVERVRPQSMAHTVRQLEGAGLVSRRKDLSDRRQVFLEITPDGQTAMTEFRHNTGTWVKDAVESRLSSAEREVVAQAIALLSRLIGSADAGSLELGEEGDLS